MSPDHEAISSFCRVLAGLRKSFRQLHIFAEKQACFSGVTTTVSHSERDLTEGETRTPMVEVSYSLDADLREHHPVAKSCGVSLAIRILESKWALAAETGYSCVKIGWEDVEFFEDTFYEPSQLAARSDAILKRAFASYKGEVERLLAGEAPLPS